MVNMSLCLTKATTITIVFKSIGNHIWGSFTNMEYNIKPSMDKSSLVQ